MRKLLVIAGVCAFSLWAADFWTSKPFTDWDQKEVQKIIDNSPWAKQFNIVVSGGGGGSSSGGRREKGGGSMGETDSGGGGGGGNPGGSRYPSAQSDTGGATSISYLIRWQSALPIKQAMVKAKYGAEAATAPDARKILDADEPAYVIVVSGLNRGLVRGDADEVKQRFMGSAELVIKGKEPIKAADFRFTGERIVDLVFAFPKTNPITIDDKEVEFDCKIGTTNLRQKFNLKQMMFNGKLEL
ncbi:MAG TPA: hypothetical protein VKS01_04485 [Bryobacteraceae bacterium]|nr:hypothetical protein [Bryobacteraceae bacterium]